MIGMDIRIKRVRPQDNLLINHIATVTHQAFHHLRPSENLQNRIEKYQKRVMERPESPQAVFAGFLNDECVGTISVVDSDLADSTLTPWLASLWVDPRFRHQGIARQLIEHSVKHIHNHKIDTVYLFTDTLTDFYKKLGWTVLEKRMLHEYPITVLYRTG
ncbi:N-acetyltransferase [Candidatus Nomurabacteria bacterium]|nr:N-acetyltransferase [Candidatus Nomurabacteria bacterium]